jgi:hypothetical protein
MVQIDEKILPHNDKKNPAFIVRDARESAAMKSSIMTQCWCMKWKVEYKHGPKKLPDLMFCTQAMQRNEMLRRVVDEPAGAHNILPAGNRINLSQRSQQICVT